MGKRLLAIIAIITLALAAVACDRQACYEEGKRNNRPPLPFAHLGTELAPFFTFAP
ncbi:MULTISPECIES: hypothetical protein [Microbulbifer]|uniref:Lipoprotein n=1 Tax=Microbulbifer celer TaxID=435905 RepID=A0ABW3U7Z5_9GAMM|nr:MULTISPECIES: hypothetical protein [Microbulbifer]UFN57260.1 hypothetical protein LPW13_17090 [Microbulbifer celer]